MGNYCSGNDSYGEAELQVQEPRHKIETGGRIATAARRDQINATVKAQMNDPQIRTKFYWQDRGIENWILQQYGKIHQLLLRDMLFKIDDDLQDFPEYSDEQNEAIAKGELSPKFQTICGWNIQFGIDKSDENAVEAPFYLALNGVPISDMPFASYFTHEQKEYNETSRNHTFVFQKGHQRSVCTVDHSSEDKTISMTLNKVQKTFTGQAFGDMMSALPVVLNDVESGVEAVVDFDTEIKEWVLNINGEPFETLQYLVSDQKLAESCPTRSERNMEVLVEMQAENPALKNIMPEPREQ